MTYYHIFNWALLLSGLKWKYGCCWNTNGGQKYCNRWWSPRALQCLPNRTKLCVYMHECKPYGTNNNGAAVFTPIRRYFECLSSYNRNQKSVIKKRFLLMSWFLLPVLFGRMSCLGPSWRRRVTICTKKKTSSHLPSIHPPSKALILHAALQGGWSRPQLTLDERRGVS